MRSTNVTTAVTYAVLGIAVGASFLLPTLSVRSVRALTPPPEIELTGLVRDFLAAHPDMDPGCSGCSGHFAGNVQVGIGSDKRPVYAGTGTNVVTEWTDANGQPIAPHLYNTYGTIGSCYRIPGLAADGFISIKNSSIVDSFDSLTGPYGGLNVGADALISTNSVADQALENQGSSMINGSVLGGPGGDINTIYYTTGGATLTGTKDVLDHAVPIPSFNAPSNLGPSIGPVVYDAGTSQLTGDLHADSLTLNSGAILEIVGDITILIEGDVDMIDDTCEVQIAADSSLRLFIKGDAQMHAHINMNTGDPSRCTIYKLGTGFIECLGNQALVVARFYMPEAELRVFQSSEVFGTFVGDRFDLDNNARFHVDLAYSGQPDFVPDTTGTAGIGASGATAFTEWFRDMPGVNISQVHTITLLRDLAGVYEYLDDTFHPIDDMLFGNEGNSHNSHLTYVITAEFDHLGCGNYFIEFQGGDGVWLFIDGQLALDLGGLGSATTQYVELNRFDLVEGQTYEVRLFYSQRHTSTEAFRLRTNIELRQGSVPTVSAQYD